MDPKRPHEHVGIGIHRARHVGTGPCVFVRRSMAFGGRGEGGRGGGGS